MGRYTVKTYVVQQADAQGNLIGPVVGVKLTFKEAHEIARDFAPAKVTCIMADKTAIPNNPDHPAFQQECN